MKKGVLLVDDNIDLAENLQEVLEEEGVEATIAESGAAALELLEQQEFGLVVTDMKMPGMSGIDVLREIHLRWPGLPVVIMTAYAKDSLLREARLEGALAVQSKPLDLGFLRALVERIMPPSAPILVVERDRETRTAITDALRGIDGAIPYAAPDLGAARRILGEVDCRVAIVDAVLPDGRGVDFGAELQELAPSMHVVYVCDGRRELEETLGAVFGSERVRVLEKPFSPERLLGIMEEVM